MAKTFSFSRHSRFVNQFKGRKSKLEEETSKFTVEINYKKNFKKHKALIAQQKDVAKILKDIEIHQ